MAASGPPAERAERHATSRLTILRLDGPRGAGAVDATPGEAAVALAGSVWVDADGERQPAVVDALAAGLGLDAETREVLGGAVGTLRAAVDGARLAIRFDSARRRLDGRVELERVGLALGPYAVLTVQSRPGGDVFAPVRRRLAVAGPGDQARGAGAVFVALVSAAVEALFPILEGVDSGVEQLELSAGRPSGAALAHLRQARQETAKIRQAAWSLREAIVTLEHEAAAHLGSAGLARALVRAGEALARADGLRGALDGAAALIAAAHSQRLAEIVRVLTVFGSVFLALSFIAGLYGMNFTHMPGLSARYGFPAVLAVMAAVAVGLLAFFRRRHWW